MAVAPKHPGLGPSTRGHVLVVLAWPRELRAASNSRNNAAALLPNPPSFPKTLAGSMRLVSIAFSNHCRPALPYSCPISLLLEPKFLAREPHCWASPRKSSTDPKIWVLEVPTRASPAPGGRTDCFTRPPRRILRKEGRARQETIFATPKLNNYHLGCGKPSPAPQAPAPRTHQHPGRGPHRRPPPTPRGFAEECRGRWRGEQPRHWEGNQLESRSLMK